VRNGLVPQKKRCKGRGKPVLAYTKWKIRNVAKRTKFIGGEKEGAKKKWAFKERLSRTKMGTTCLLLTGTKAQKHRDGIATKQKNEGEKEKKKREIPEREAKSVLGKRGRRKEEGGSRSDQEP